MKNNKYINGKIYKLYVENEPWMYIGSTIQKLNNRLYGHRARAKECPDNRTYNMFNKIGWENVNIELIEEFPCNSVIELHTKEKEYINMHLDNLRLLNIQHSHLNMCNFDKNKYQNPSFNKNKNVVQTEYLIKQAKYRDKNKEHKKEYDKVYNEVNKDYIRKRMAIKVTCNCGTIVTKQHFRRHENKSKRHLKFLNNACNLWSESLKTDEPT